MSFLLWGAAMTMKITQYDIEEFSRQAEFRDGLVAIRLMDIRTGQLVGTIGLEAVQAQATKVNQTVEEFLSHSGYRLPTKQELQIAMKTVSTKTDSRRDVEYALQAEASDGDDRGDFALTEEDALSRTHEEW